MSQVHKFRADLAWEEGDLAAAAEGYAASLAPLVRSGWQLGLAGLRAQLACVLYLAGEQERACALLEEIQREPVPTEAVIVELARVLVSGDRRRLLAALERRHPMAFDPLPVRILVERLRALS
jgi:hypothetical protein